MIDLKYDKNMCLKLSKISCFQVFKKSIENILSKDNITFIISQLRYKKYLETNL